MASYSVADAKNNLPRLIKQAMEGEEVVITRHGKPVAELRSKQPPPVLPARDRRAVYEWLKAQRGSRKAVDIDSVTLLNEMNDESDY